MTDNSYKFISSFYPRLALTGSTPARSKDLAEQFCMTIVEGDREKFNSFVRGYTIPGHPLSGSCGYDGVSRSFLPFAASLYVDSGGERIEREWVVDAVLKAGLAYVNEVDRGGWSALTYAVSVGNVKTVKVLIDAGADVYVRDAQGRTLFDLTHDATIIGMILEKHKQCVPCPSPRSTTR
jgi:hypothetical protein